MTEQKPYHIYGRTNYEEPLTFIKKLAVAASVKEETLADVGQDDWVELIAIPADSLIYVIGKKADD